MGPEWGSTWFIPSNHSCHQIVLDVLMQHQLDRVVVDFDAMAGLG
jgi:hypothetical protein